MAITPLTVTIDLNPSYKKIPAVYVSQLDNNLRELAITVQDGGVNYDVASSGYDVYIEGTKPDYKGFSYDVTDIGGTIVGSVITVPMQTQMTCVKGMVSTEIVLKSGSDRIGSANFLLVVERAGLDEDTDVSETDIPGYIDGAQRAAEAAEDAKDLAVAAKDTAVSVAASIPEDYTTLSNDVEDLKSALIESENLSGVNAGLIRSETFTLGKTFDSNGIPVNASNRAITDFIKCAGSSVLVVVPLDGSVKTNLYVYDANKNHLAHGSYNNTTRVVYNQNAVYVRFVLSYNNNSTADQKLLDSVRIYNNIERMGGTHRGNVVKLGYTTLAQCGSDGYYSFGANDVSSITDLPYDIMMGDSGGIVQTFSYYAGGIPLQVIFAKGKMYYRYGVNPFIPVSEDDAADVAITWEKGAINQTTGADADSSARIRSNGNIPVGEGVKIKIPAEMELSVIAYNSNDERIATTGLQQADFYHYPYYGESYFRVFGGYIDSRTTITADDGKKYGIQYIPIASDAPMWYALGDSITQGYYSEVGTSGIAGETPNGYPTYAALANGWRLRNMGVGGSGYIKASDTLNKPNARGQVDTIDFSYCDICTLAFGVNDWHYNQSIGTVNDSKELGTTMASNMKYVIEKILSDNPLCRLNVMLPMNSSAYGGDFASDWGLGTSLPTSGTLQHVIDIIKGIAEMYHLPIIDQSNTGIVNRFNINEALPDGIHPSKDTMKPYGERIAKQIV